MNKGVDEEVGERVRKAIPLILANQASNGGFSLWGRGDADNMWLNAYVTEFLTRAREKGHDVPETAMRLAIDNLRNGLAYASEFDSGGEDVAYALYVLARNGRAAIGDLRYYAEARLESFATPMAKAQLAAALALYGDTRNAAATMRAAIASLRQDEDDAGKAPHQNFILSSKRTPARSSWCSREPRMASVRKIHCLVSGRW